MRDAVQGWETLVRGTISKGRFVQGAQHSRTFGRGHIGQGHINPASKKGLVAFNINEAKHTSRPWGYEIGNPVIHLTAVWRTKILAAYCSSPP
jgi:hypothetical protein